jgi:phosphoglycerol transferase MdoB-like AlkP superfamily enzyme
VVFILMESWNFDYVDSFSGGHYGVTPNLDALARDGLRFTRFYAAGQRSIDGIQATLTGIPTLMGMPRIDNGIGVSNFSRLGSLVKERGYSTLFMQTSKRDSFKIQGIATAAGFDDFYGMEDVPLLLDYPDPNGAVFGWDYDTLQFMKGRIDELQKPFLAYFFTGTTHQPYPELPKQFMKLTNEPTGENGYLNTLGYADWSIGQFVQAARQESWFDNTVFIFTADHTNLFQKGVRYQRFHTPMLIYSPRWVKAGESRVIGSQLDLIPTIMDLLGIDSEYAALGESLLHKPGEGEAFVSYGGQNLGLISREGFLRHDLQRIMEAEGIDPQQLPQMEKQLLARDQLVYELLQANRWAR